eukprot:UN17287
MSAKGGHDDSSQRNGDCHTSLFVVSSLLRSSKPVDCTFDMAIRWSDQSEEVMTNWLSSIQNAWTKSEL